MMMLDRRLQYRRRPLFAAGIERMTSFHDAPAVIRPFFYEVGLLPQVLPVLANPEMPCLPVGGHPPGVAQAVGPDLRPGPLEFHKGIVLGHGVGFAWVRPIYIDAQ